MKAVLNAVLACRLDESPFGARHITLDHNRYQSPQLAFVLRERYGILSTGTCRANRIGWNKDIMNMTKTGTQRGGSHFGYDEVRRVMCLQWNDSKVVNISSSSPTSHHRCPSCVSYFVNGLFPCDQIKPYLNKCPALIYMCAVSV